MGRRPIGVVITPTLGTYPATSIPLSANRTVTPDVVPTNAMSMNVSASTNFKGKLEANPATGVVRVTDAHPAGTYSVSVKAFNSSGGSAITTFDLIVTTRELCDSVSFGTATSFGAGSGPRSVAVGDFNRDGVQDLATANYFSANVSILLGDGVGNFGTAANFAAGMNPYSVAVGDFNGDGNQDLATANFNSNNVSILLGDGAGSFSAASNFAVGSLPYAVAVGDFNGDGKQDLATANFNSNDVSILLGDGAGSFGAGTPFTTGVNTHPVSIAVGDFNGDGNQDLATANNISNNVSILLGNGAGSFSVPTNFGAGSFPSGVAAGDFNGDGEQDLAVANQNSNNVTTLLGSGTGSFVVAGSTTVNQPFSLAVGDFNGDNTQDLAVASYSSGASVLLWYDGSFGSHIDFSAGSSVSSVVVGDFNGDGKQDLAVANFVDNKVSILLNNCQISSCTVCHKHTMTITLPCNSLELLRHRDHGDPAENCPLIVTTTDDVVADDGKISLREAIDTANAQRGADVITFNIPASESGCTAANACTIRLATELPPINELLTIDGAPNNGHITVDGNHSVRAGFVVASTVTFNVQNLTMANGKASDCGFFAGSCGGAMVVNASTVNAANITVMDNTASEGGGIFVFYFGMSIGGRLNVTNSTFFGNNATQGGGIYSRGSLLVINSTFSGNSATAGVGGIVAGGVGQGAMLKNSIVANNNGGDCANPLVTADSYNLDTDGTCGNASTKTAAEINLQPLANNGGPTMTMALQLPSAAVDMGDDAVAAAPPVNNMDQRGVARPKDGDNDGIPVSDVGAYELSPALAPPAKRD